MRTNPAERLSLDDLQSPFDPDTLQQVDQLVALLDDRGPDTLPISSDKRRLAQVYVMANLDRMGSRQFRRKLLSTLDGQELEALASQAGGAGQDRETTIRAFSSCPWTRNPMAMAFVEVLGLTTDVLPTEGGEQVAPGLSVLPAARLPLRWPMDYQYQAHSDVLAAFRDPYGRTLLQLPTGAGKTYTALNAVITFLGERQRRGMDCRIVWLAHAKELCVQAVESFHQLWSARGTGEMPEYRAWDGKGFPEDVQPTSIIFSTLQTARARIASGTSWQADLIVLDEAHIALAPTYKKTLEQLEGHDCRTLGLTATPGRGSLGEENERLATFFGQRRVGLTGDQGDAISQLQKRLILARQNWEPLETDVEFSLDEQEAERIRSGEDFSESFLVELGKNLLRNKAIVAKLEQLIKDGRRILYFAPSVEQSKATAVVLGVRGHRVFHLDGTTPKAARSYAVEEFRRGGAPLLCNYGVLAAGFDAPATDCVVIARPTTSLIQYSQMIGRGLRGPRLGGSPECKVVQVVDLFTSLPSDLNALYASFSNYWQG